ncbi:hypothetical protein FBUS_00933 [Fasciolopsis buskii]|uniref:acylglycerol lipase n=1 Tax=Fasciolopsis buskii TaxID=27845 RepID=A0A8E0RUN9_9TREM|nr:hypothetical protein FBUS_00933 [Fasciolopsis buski]
MDLPGHGRSPIPFSDQPSRQYYLDCCPSVCQDPSYKQICRSFSFAELSADVLAVFDHFAQEDSSARTVINVIVAHSYGTSFALYVAHERPDKVHRLVLISGGAPVSLEPFCWPYCLPLGFFKCFWTCIVRHFRRNAFGSSIPVKSNKVHGTKATEGIQKPNKNEPEGVLLQDDIERSFSIDPLVLRATMRGQSWPEGDVIYHKTIRVPTLLMIGDRDRYVTIEEEGLMLQTLPCATMRIIYGTGHMMMLESPDRVNTHIQGLIVHPPQFDLYPRRPICNEQPNSVLLTRDTCVQDSVE